MPDGQHFHLLVETPRGNISRFMQSVLTGYKDAEGIVRVVARVFGVEVEDMRRTIRGSMARPVAARMLLKHAGLTQRAAGRELGYGTGSAVSHQLKSLSERRVTDVTLSKRIRKIEREIARLD
ncbi:hypothetical protein ACFLQU_03710 [Verrucomicrobiota bacterium]